MQVLIFQLVTTLVERLGELAQPHAQAILSWIPAAWDGAAGQGTLRTQARCSSSRALRACISNAAFDYWHWPDLQG